MPSHNLPVFKHSHLISGLIYVQKSLLQSSLTLQFLKSVAPQARLRYISRRVIIFHSHYSCIIEESYVDTN